MKRLVYLVCILLVAVATVSGQILTPLNSENAIDESSIESVSVLENENGDIFIVYLKNSELVAQVSTDGGDSFAPYALNLSEQGFSSIKDVKLVKRTVHEWLVFYIATYDSKEGIYALRFDEAGALVLAFPEGLESPGINGLVETYKVQYAGSGDLSVIYLKGGFVGYTYVTFEDADIYKIVLSTNSTVNAFQLTGRMDADELLICGLFEEVSENIQTISYYELMDDQLLVNNVVIQGEGISNYQLVSSLTGSTYFLYMISGKLYGKRYVNSLWEDLNEGITLNHPVIDPIEKYSAFLMDENLIVFFEVTNSGKRMIYGIRMSGVTGCVLLNEGNPFGEAGINGIPQLMLLFDLHYLLGYIEGDEKTFFLQKYGLETNTWIGIEPDITINGTIENILLTAFDVWDQVMALTVKNGMVYSIDIHTYDFITGEFSLFHTIDIPEGSVPIEIKLINEDLLMVMTDTGKLIFHFKQKLTEMQIIGNLRDLEDNIPDKQFVRIDDNNCKLYFYLKQ